eukprot:1150672_1
MLMALDVYRNQSPMHVRSLLSSNETNGDTNNSNYDESFLGRRLYGLPIFVYFAFLFGIVCIVWIGSIVALCIGYSKRRKTIRQRGEIIRRRKQQSETRLHSDHHTTNTNHDIHQNTHKNKVINVKPPKRLVRANVILPLPPQRMSVTPTNSNSSSNKKISSATQPGKGMVILPKPNALLSTHHNGIGLSVSYPSDNDIIQQMENDWASENATNIFDSPLRKIPVIDSGTTSAPSLDLVNNSANTNAKNISMIYAKHFGHNMSNETATSTDIDEQTQSNTRNIYNRSNYYYGNSANTNRSKRRRPHTTRPNHEYHYHNRYDGDANSDPSDSESIPLNLVYLDLHKGQSSQRKSRRTRSDTSMYSSDYDERKLKRNNHDYTTKNTKNPFQMHAPDFGAPYHGYHMSLQQQIQMRSPDSDLEPISLPNHESNTSIRFPNESMPFNNINETETDTETATVATETETDKDNGGVGMQIRIEKAPYIADSADSAGSRSTNNQNKKSQPISPISHVSNTPQPISAPLSPKALSDTMPIRPLSQAKKSPFHLPPPSIALQRIHSPEQLYYPKSSSQTETCTMSATLSNEESHEDMNSTSDSSTMDGTNSSSDSSTKSSHSKSQSSQTDGNEMVHYSLDQTDLFAKLAKMDHDDDDDDDSSDNDIELLE